MQADEAAIMAVAEEMDLDAKLATSVKRLRAAGWEIVIASAGCRWYIERLLSRRGVEIPIYANPGVLAVEGGLMMTPPSDSPYYAASTGIDKEAVTREAVRRHSCVAFAGDGRPDLAAAMLVPPELRFARGWLAKHLSAAQIPFRAFAHWSEIAEMLLCRNVQGTALPVTEKNKNGPSVNEYCG
jgi:2-hydroxy-3-keto-5-methylthiopentenyl-1-phosphate phosphatase